MVALALALAGTACGSTNITAIRDPALPTVGPTEATAPAPLACPARLELRTDASVVLPDPPAGSQAAAKPERGPVPSGAVQALVCRYSSMDDGPAGSVETTPNRLAQQGAVSTPAQVAALVDQLDAGGPWKPGTYSCPADFGAHDLVILRYSDQSQLQALVCPTGCATASTARSGNFQVTGALAAHLMALAGRWVPNV